MKMPELFLITNVNFCIQKQHPHVKEAIFISTIPYYPKEKSDSYKSL